MTGNAEQYRDIDVEDLIPEITYAPDDSPSPDEAWNAIDKTYGESAYQTLINSYVNKVMPNNGVRYKEALTEQSLDRYKLLYNSVHAEFMREAEPLADKFESAKDAIREKTEMELSILKSSLEGSQKLAKFPKAIPQVSNKSAVKAHFSDLLEALEGRYINNNVDAGIMVPFGVPIISALVDPDSKKGKGVDGYVLRSADFQRNMEKWVGNKLEWIMKNKPDAEKLKAFRKEVITKYASYSQIDKNSGIISSKDLEALVMYSTSPSNVLKKMMDESNDAIIPRLEVVQVMNPDTWEAVVKQYEKVAIEQTVNNKTEKEFIKQMNAIHKERGIDRIDDDFDSAKDSFKEILSNLSVVGAPETLEFLRKFNTDVNGDLLKLEKGVPEPLRDLVKMQLDHLYSARLVPELEHDRMLVRFMTADLEGRNDILSNDETRATLLRGIRFATDVYPKKYEKLFSRIPDDPSKIKFSKNITNPKYHDKAARVQALIVLGGQAKIILEKINAPYAKQISSVNVPENIDAVKMGINFKTPTPQNIRYVSDIVRGGFNFRDIALKGVKIFGALTVMANVIQSWGEAGEEHKGLEGIVDRVFMTGELTATNHVVAAAAAVTVGSFMAERDPRLLKYWKLSESERASVWAGLKIDKLQAVLGHKTVENFLGNNDEWNAMRHDNMSTSQIKELIKSANERAKENKGKALIKIEDIEEIIPNSSITVGLIPGGRSARMRFLFYQKFLSGSTKPDVGGLREACTGTSHISPSPTTKES